MPSLLPGYEYDIFVSYRQKDNRSDQWVTHFVQALQNELDATFKENISIYFDNNPHDGIGENHDVDKSLLQKIKALIFIPIISQTYCDPNCFAWKNEFCSFNQLAKSDALGRDVRLLNGNVASRILPVQIHEIEEDDLALLETEIGGPFRCIDLTYREPGVNRPLKPTDDRSTNLHKTNYENQINKLANAVKEILVALNNPKAKATSPHDREPSAGRKRSISKPALLSLVILTMALSIYIIFRLIQPVTTQLPDLSIAVMPFVNLSGEPDQEVFCDGMTDEIITQLTNIPDLIVISRSSSMSFKGTKKTLRQVADELNVNFILEGSIRRSDNDLLISAELIDASRDSHLWAEKFSGGMEDVFDIQENVARSLVDKLRIKLTPAENKRLYNRSFDNPQAFEFYLRSKIELFKWNEGSIKLALQDLERGVDIIGPNPVLYAGLAYAYWSFANLGIDEANNFDKAEDWVDKTFELDADSPEGTMIQGLLFQTRYGKQGDAIRSFKKVLSLRPYDSHALTWLSISYIVSGKMEAAKLISDKLMRIDPLNHVSQAMPLVIRFYAGEFEGLSDRLKDVYNLEPENRFWAYFFVLALATENRQDDALDFIKEHPSDGTDNISKITNALKYAILKMPDSVSVILEDPLVVEGSKIDCQYAQFVSSIYARAGLEGKSLQWLNQSIERGFTNFRFIDQGDPAYYPIRSHLEFQKLVSKAREAWNQVEE